MTQAASGYARIEGDKYFTPAWVTEALLRVETFAGPVTDPAAGAGHIVDVFTANGFEANGLDIAPDAPHITGPIDFLTTGGEPYALVTNPPYGKGGRLAVEFIKHALKLTEAKRGKVAMLLRVDFDSADTRRPIFNDHPAFSAKYTLTRRIRWANIEQKGSGPTENHAWYLWSWEHAKRGGSRHYGYLP